MVACDNVGTSDTNLADQSCEKYLQEMMDKKLGDLSCDSTYSSAHWHPNKITSTTALHRIDVKIQLY